MVALQKSRLSFAIGLSTSRSESGLYSTRN